MSVPRCGEAAKKHLQRGKAPGLDQVQEYVYNTRLKNKGGYRLLSIEQLPPRSTQWRPTLEANSSRERPDATPEVYSGSSPFASSPRPPFRVVSFLLFGSRALSTSACLSRVFRILDEADMISSRPVVQLQSNKIPCRAWLLSILGLV